ncbi:MAG: 4-hydroxythreonine-4-phosphate dehydrogenase PdxA [Alphaproteobacteria bacterium]|jgi:4-hydroxythreonine-4-phosphate dehydrogenase|nr:4-hydroxythreonine-4-phosphate dehydrogenase PdxA [Alphaproteobacteria bacterium]
MAAQRPLVVSMGDPAGVGLEVALIAARDALADLPFFVLLADLDAVEATARRVGYKGEIRSGMIADAVPGGLHVIHTPLNVRASPGRPDPRNAETVRVAIEAGVRLAAAGEAAGLVTLPIAKAVMYEAGFLFPGHTEFIAALLETLAMAGPRGPVMMLAGDGLRVSLATIHTPLRDVASALTQARVERAARVTLHALACDFGIAGPRLAIAGLNPHAGESGALGREEIEIIGPVAARLRAEGHRVSDPLPADTLFHPEARASYDAVLAMYHDQGLIPVKTVDFFGAVNVTLGLPIVRTSPDHGVAFDRAGLGVARADSFIAALKLAAELGARRAEQADRV